MTSNEKRLNHNRLLERLDYDPKTGQFTFKTAGASNRERDVGSVAGYVKVAKDGYKRFVVPVDAVYFTGSRLAWFFMTKEWPKGQIDHKDGDSLNNSFENLRDATASQNVRNRGKLKSNTSGWKGVSFHKGTQKWCASITVDRKRIYLGYFDDVKEAAEAYIFAALEHHGEFAKV